ncbi:tyrosine-type recombinase/integrase [Blastococcus sp. Marseille-P5729]|uniref:tyrosine-type recombinase/integrase n=1 Tax=Blastococcus sp. Marseille-P5729 TaxID=2086582 RepID=UPI001F174EEB|nr:tyrosine-type recombinase/integrase [Blastococcus sp. Marseille-P5729]
MVTHGPARTARQRRPQPGRRAKRAALISYGRSRQSRIGRRLKALGPLIYLTGTLSESNWKRKVDRTGTLKRLGHQGLRPHDLRHTCASIWLGAGADPKVVQRVLGHASATMTMDLYGHLIDENLWKAARAVSISSQLSNGVAGEESS